MKSNETYWKTKYFSFDSCYILICIDLAVVVIKTEYPLSNIEIKKLTERCSFNHLADQHIEVNSGKCVPIAVRWLLPED